MDSVVQQDRVNMSEAEWQTRCGKRECRSDDRDPPLRRDPCRMREGPLSIHEHHRPGESGTVARHPPAPFSDRAGKVSLGAIVLKNPAADA